MDLETSTTDSWEAFGSTLKYQSFGKLWSNLPTTSVQSRTGTLQDPLGGHGEPLLIWKSPFSSPSVIYNNKGIIHSWDSHPLSSALHSLHQIRLPVPVSKGFCKDYCKLGTLRLESSLKVLETTSQKLRDPQGLVPYTL